MERDSEIKWVVLSAGTRDELYMLLEEHDAAHLAFKDPNGKTVGTILGPAQYNLLRAAADIAQNPEKHGYRLKPYWDNGPRISAEDIFSNAPRPILLRIRRWLYDKRVLFYRKVGIRPTDA
jgi:hypothetical protein